MSDLQDECELPPVDAGEPVTTPATVGSMAVFRAIFHLPTKRPPLAKGFVVDPASTKLKASFVSLDYDLLAVEAPQLGTNRDALVVSAKKPRQLVSVVLASAHISDFTAVTCCVWRLDTRAN